MSKRLPTLAPPISSALGATLLRVLRPVVRLMLARGVTMPLAHELLKRAYLEVADATAEPGSDVSAVTGVSPQDVKRLRASPNEEPEWPLALSIGVRLVSVWTTHAPWVDTEGTARPLPRSGDASFDALLASIRPDADGGALLDEWLRMGVVRIDERARIALTQPAFVPQTDGDEKLAYLALNVGDHSTAAVENMLGRADPWLERSVHYRGVTPALVARLREQASELGMQSLQIVNAEAQRTAEVAAEGSAGSSFTFGVYFHAEHPPAQNTD